MTSACGTFSYHTANASADCATQKLYNDMGTSGNTISGLFAGWIVSSGDSSGNMNKWRSISTTQQYPKIMGCDYAGANDPIQTAVAKCNQLAIAWFQAGGIVKIDVHFDNPGVSSDSDFASLADLSSPLGQKWQAQLDQIASGLKDLQSAGVPVMFRPFLEMNQCGFWWSCHAHDFPAVWQKLYTYFTQTKGLNNLLWVYSPQNMGNVGDVQTYYPGAAYVDFASFDLYGNPENDFPAYRNALKNLPGNKLVGLGEVGPGGSENSLQDPSGTYQSLVGLIQQNPITYFMCWSDQWSPANAGSGGQSFINGPWMNLTNTSFRFP